MYATPVNRAAIIAAVILLCNGRLSIQRHIHGGGRRHRGAQWCGKAMVQSAAEERRRQAEQQSWVHAGRAGPKVTVLEAG